MIPTRGHSLLERMLGGILPKVALESSAQILVNNHIFTLGGTMVTKCRQQVHLLERSLRATFLRVLEIQFSFNQSVYFNELIQN